jgi:hypothetical protein
MLWGVEFFCHVDICDLRMEWDLYAVESVSKGSLNFLSPLVVLP